MTEPANDNPPGSYNNKRRQTLAAVFLLSALIVIVIALGADRNAPPPIDKTATVAETPAPPPPDSGVIDPAAITAWQRAAAAQNIDITLYNPLYVQDARTYNVLLVPKDPASGLPTYQTDIERGSNRILGFSRAP